MNAPIPALRPLRPIEAWPRQAGGREAQVGELLRLRVAQATDGGLLGDTEDGLQLGLPPGLARPGDMLLLRVLSREPRLELQLLRRDAAPDTVPDEAPGDEWGWRALRPDQGRLQRWHLNQDARLPAQLAVQWRALMLAEQLRPPHGPTGQALGPESLLVAHAAPLQLTGWLGQMLWLRLLSPLGGFWPAPAGHDEAAQEGATAEAGVADGGVCLSLNVATTEGWVLVLLQWRHGLLLHCCAERAEALPWLRARLPVMARALAAVPLRLRHCSLGLRPPPLPEAGPAQRAQGLASAASQPLFRAAAEVVRVLQA
ncbi:hypothetical protein [Roseateles sp.]|uniref:hypothetical protein n=1 Tax=Roseateles sp. TaxID=1971397 RepID=UPI0025E7F7B0|nr:hypothetical protein [Roseateles sp.]MBV8036753.1 hypothetical protein [Roseateles sp.]